MRGLTLINSLPVRSDDANFFAADASKLYRQSNEAILLFLIIGGEGILVHDDNRSVMCAARPRKLWENLFDYSDEVGFLPCKFRLVPMQHGQYLIAFQLKAAIRGRSLQTADSGFTPSNARVLSEKYYTITVVEKPGFCQVALGLDFLFVMPFLARLRMISTPATRVSLDNPR